MNTLTHILIGTAMASCLGGRPRPRLRPNLMAAAFAGAVFPDISILVMVGWEMGVMGIAESELWNQAYYREPWVTYSALTNSFFVFGALLILGWWRRWPVLIALSLSALLHFAGDIFLHYDDGHAHFWPLSYCVYYSPVSYWDPAHYGLWWTGIEMVLAAGLGVYLWTKAHGWGQRAYIGGVVGLFLAMSAAFFVLMLTSDGMDDRLESSGHGTFAQPACPGSIDEARQHAQT